MLYFSNLILIDFLFEINSYLTEFLIILSEYFNSKSKNFMRYFMFLSNLFNS